MIFRNAVHKAGRLEMARQSGFGLIELMVAITIGLLLTVAMLTLYVDVGRSNNEMNKANTLMENGRFALQLLQSDVSHAGFWGEVDNSLAAPTAIPSLCATSTWSTSGANLMGVPVQGFTSGTSLSACSSGLADAVSGESVLAVVHANTCFRGGDCESGDTGPHFQVSTCDGVAAGSYVIAGAPDSASLTLTKKDCVTSAELRKVVSSIYYVASRNNIPTLMRASLVNGAYEIEPLVEGVERFWVEYGVDSLGRNGLAISTSNPGDGSADQYVSCAPCTLPQLANVVSVKVHLLVRSLESTAGYADAKTYVLGSRTVAANDSFKRHVFSSTIRLVNPSSRREVP